MEVTVTIKRTLVNQSYSWGTLACPFADGCCFSDGRPCSTNCSGSRNVEQGSSVFTFCVKSTDEVGWIDTPVTTSGFDIPAWCCNGSPVTSTQHRFAINGVPTSTYVVYTDNYITTASGGGSQNNCWKETGTITTKLKGCTGCA